MTITLAKNNRGILEAECKSDRWEDFDRLISYIKKEHAGRVIYKAEGPDARTWHVTINGEKVIFQQLDTGGIWFFAEKSDGEKVVESISRNLRAIPSWDTLPKLRGFPRN